MSNTPAEYGVAPPLHEVPRSPRWPWVLMLVVALLAVGGVVYGPQVVDSVRAAVRPGGAEPPPPVEPPPVPAMRSVVFEVTGLGKAFNVTATAGTSVKNEAGVTLPWRHVVQVPADAPKTVMLVVVAGPDGAEVHGRYTVDGVVVRTGSASGPYGVLTITDS
ncbi:hypothetical protein V1227_00185 [Lentzea sp. DG1S-22]|uniref:hypothetical protein n=1 Tax=Lentzea sp. DG1S-22 TaxID=3108822 RepID=UPI002E79A784|nr:hypothetical protein [Lentzea sp. DG1S-22]WVH81206.1 hypothetical protein V1227_00185 [Lentzea sp. DG1S-22]